MSTQGRNPGFTLIPDLDKSQEIPSDGILTRSVFDDERVKAVLFTFSANQELSEHTASMPAVLHFLEGEAELTLGEQRVTAQAGTWVHMEANLKHSIRTNTPVVMLLLLLKSRRTSGEPATPQGGSVRNRREGRGS